MIVKLNGEDVEIKNQISLMELLFSKVNDIDKIVVEFNYEIVKKEDWQEIKLKNGDNIEVLKFVGGG